MSVRLYVGNLSFDATADDLRQIFGQSGEVEDAIVEFRTTLVYCPENLVAHYGLGTVYADEGRDNKKAIWHFEALLEIDPQFSRADEVRKRLLELTW